MLGAADALADYEMLMLHGSVLMTHSRAGLAVALLGTSAYLTAVA